MRGIQDRLRLAESAHPAPTEADGALEKVRGLPLWEPAASPMLV